MNEGLPYWSSLIRSVVSNELRGALTIIKLIKKVYTCWLHKGLPFSKLFLHFSGHGTKQLGTEEYFSQASFLSPGKYYGFILIKRREKVNQNTTFWETVFTNLWTFSKALRKVRVLLTIVVSFTLTRINSYIIFFLKKLYKNDHKRKSS